MNPAIWPILMIFGDICAAVNYAVTGEYAKAIYWVAAAVLTATTIFM